MIKDNKAIVDFVRDKVLYEHSSEELQELIDRMPEDENEALEDFCGALELGNWFYEALIINEIDVSELMIDLAEERQQEEREAADERYETMVDLQRAQGWPS